jgi:hypothetical protein
MSNDIQGVSTQAMADFNAIFNVDALSGDLTDSVSGGFAVVSIRGGKFHIRHDGSEVDVLDANGDPRTSIEVVMLKANGHLQKTYYEGAYVQGSTENPDCFSNDGVTPHASVENPQSVSCTNCPMNQWGSRVTDQGTKAKACGDSRRMAVVPAEDITNDKHDGAMLLRVPAASLKPLAQYGKVCQTGGYPYNAIVTKIGFDPSTSYPKLTFKAVRPLTDAEKLEVAKVWSSVDNVLEGDEAIAATVTSVTAAPPPVEVEAPAPLFEAEPEDEVAEAPAPVKKKTSKKKKVAAKKAPVGDTLDDATEDALDDIMSEFDLS